MHLTMITISKCLLTCLERASIIKSTRDIDDSFTSFLVKLEDIDGFGSTLPLIGGSVSPVIVLSEFGSKLYLMYADVRLHILMTHRDDTTGTK